MTVNLPKQLFQYKNLQNEYSGLEESIKTIIANLLQMKTFLNKATNNNLKLVAYETFIDAENVLQSSGFFVSSFLVCLSKPKIKRYMIVTILGSPKMSQ